MGASGAIQALYMKVLMQKTLIVRMPVLLVKQRVSVSEPAFVGG